MKAKIKEVYYCEYCKKHGLSKHNMEHHEKICFKNPDNYRPCFSCKHLDKKDAYIFYNSYLGEYEYKIELLYCNKKDIYLYTPKNEIKNNQFELEDGNNPMPKVCELYKERSFL